MVKIPLLLAYRVRAYFFFFIDILKANLDILKKPYKLTYVVTKKCNSKCLNCSIWKQKEHHDLTLFQVENFAKQMPQLKWIDFTGGEVILRNDFDKIIEFFSKHCKNLLYIHFPTNGLQSKQIINLANICTSKGKYKLVITVSIDGPRDLNDKLRGIKGDFDKAISTYKELKKNKKIDVYIGTTIFKSNVDYIEELFKQLQQEIDDFKFKDFHINLGHYSSHYYDNHGSKDIAQNIAIIKKIDDFIIKNQSITLSPFAYVNWVYRKELKNYALTKKTPTNCRSAKSTIYLSESGELYPCSMWDYPLGNINNMSVNDIYSSKRLESALSRIKEKDCANCWTPCEAYPAIIDQALHLKFKLKIPSRPNDPSTA